MMICPECKSPLMRVETTAPPGANLWICETCGYEQEPETLPVETMGPAAMLSAAIAKGIDAEGIKTLAEIYERMEDRRAQREFTAALLAFQRVCPPIKKTSRVSFPTRKGGTFDSQYAKLEDVTMVVRPLLQAHGFSFTFDTEIRGKEVKAICVLFHVGGHSTRTSFTAPADPEPKLSDAHSTASAVTFAQRYAFQLALGIVPGGDNDGKTYAESGAKITTEQLQALQKLLADAQADTKAFWNYAGIRKLEDLPAKDYAKIRQALINRLQKMAEAKGVKT